MILIKESKCTLIIYIYMYIHVYNFMLGLYYQVVRPTEPMH